MMFRDSLNPTVRPAKRALADRRAMVIESERENPIMAGLTNEIVEMRGQGATPTNAVLSMGGTPLSEWRGGGRKIDVGKLKKAYVKALKGKGGDSDSGSDSDSDDDAYEGGRRLFAHMMEVKGSGFANKFREGMGSRSGGNWFSNVGSFLKNNKDNINKMGDDLTKKLPPAKSVGDTLKDTLISQARGLEGALNPLAKFGLSAFGSGRGGLNTGAYEGEGRMPPANGVGYQEAKGGKRTNARASVVKKVMAEKGLSMIEASKYVKAHNLYKK